MDLPGVRTENLLEQQIGDEILIYDLTNDKAFNLNENLSIIYRECIRNSTFEEVTRRYNFTDDFIFLALDELRRNNLLAENYQTPFGKIKRREAIRRVGLATAASLPLIISIVAPTSSAAQSRTVALGGVCTTSRDCVPSASNCSSGRCCTGTDSFAGTRLNNDLIDSCSGNDICRTYQGTCDSRSAQQCCSGTGTYSCSGSGINTFCVCNCNRV